MKNILLRSLLCLLLIVVVSCKKDPKADKIEVVEALVDSTDVVEVVEEKKPVKKKKKKKKKTTESKSKEEKIVMPAGTPYFSSTAARKYIIDYEAYVSKYRKAVASKADMESFLKLSEASSSLTKQYRQLMSTLPADEMEEMSKYMQKKTKQIDELSQQM